MIWPFTRSETPTFDLIFASAILTIVAFAVLPERYGFYPAIILLSVAMVYGKIRARFQRRGEDEGV